MIKSNITLLSYKPWTRSYYADYNIGLIRFKLYCGGTRRRNFPTASRYKAYHRSVRPTCLMSHRYPYGASTEYLEKSIRSQSVRRRLTNACVVGMSRDDERNESVQRDIRVLTAKREWPRSEKISGNPRIVGNELKAKIVAEYFCGTLHQTVPQYETKKEKKSDFLSPNSK